MRNTVETALGIDCGGTNMKLAIVTRKGDVLESHSVPVHYKDPHEKVIASMAGHILKFLKKSRVKKIKGIGMGIAGDTDSQNGIVRYSPNLGWKDVPLKHILRKHLDYPVLVENDANCAAWGAYCLDAQRDCDNLICLTLGTGVGGGIIINRHLYRGATGSAGEIGHMTVRYDGRPCKCGNFGCLESMVGAWGLTLTVEDALKRDDAPVLKKMLAQSAKLKVNPESIALAASRGDLFCQQVWKDAGEILGSAISNCINIFNPDRIVLCGGVSKVGPMLMEPLLHTVGRRAFATPCQKARITISQFDQKLGVAGAGLLVWE